MDRSLVVRRVDRLGAGWNPQRRNAGAPYRDGRHAVRGTAHATMVIATRIVHCWNRGDGWSRSSSSKFVSLSCDLDVAALDSCHRARLADAVRRAKSNQRHRAWISAQAEYSAVGGRALFYGAVRSSVATLRGGSKPGNRDLLRRSHIRRVCDTIADLDVGARATGSWFRYWLHSLLARSKCVSNVRPASAKGSTRSGWQREQNFAKKIDTRVRRRSCCRASVYLFIAGANWKSGGRPTSAT